MAKDPQSQIPFNNPFYSMPKYAWLGTRTLHLAALIALANLSTFATDALMLQESPTNATRPSSVQIRRLGNQPPNTDTAAELDFYFFFDYALLDFY